MRKKITTSLLITCMVLLSCKAQNHSVTEKNSPVADSTLVYESNKVIGKITQPTTYNCKACYTISNSKIGNIKIKVPVSNRMINNQSLLEQDFAIDKIVTNGNNTIIKYSSTSSSKAYEMEVNKDYIVRLLTYSYGSKDIKIGENDYESLPANSICQSEKKIKIKDTITLNDSYVFTNKDCFDCPVNYTIEECIANKKKGVKMKWQ
ncbi:hypothetical protein ABH942_000708 [Flavobacterium sp. 28YEA47A]|uniref:hypothetical protein n=1 Tax=Flavobacterium sp. 28YEA47A TaxID=3156276 RepID=UPI003516D1F8